MCFDKNQFLFTLSTVISPIWVRFLEPFRIYLNCKTEMSNPCRIHLLSDVGSDRDFLKIFFGCGPFLKSLWNLIQHSLFYVLVFWPRGMWA